MGGYISKRSEQKNDNDDQIIGFDKTSFADTGKF
jgi:hypothetical protein